MNCMQAWKVIPGTLPIRAIDAIRNRILSFVLEIEAESPEAGEASASSRPVPPQRVNQIFNTYISGNVQNVATGSTDFQQIAKQSNGNDKVFTDLLDAIANAKADKNVAKKLAATVEEMRGARGTEKFKEHYHSFVSVLADHIQVLGPVVAPFLPSLAGMIS